MPIKQRYIKSSIPHSKVSQAIAEEEPTHRDVLRVVHERAAVAAACHHLDHLVMIVVMIRMVIVVMIGMVILMMIEDTSPRA